MRPSKLFLNNSQMIFKKLVKSTARICSVYSDFFNNNYLNCIKKNSAKLSKTIFNKAQNSWKGGNATDFTRYIQDIWKMMVDLPSSIRASFSE